jgi:uncharacterized membrane protein YfcA
LATIGLVMGLFGGMLGIGGSIIMIPALTLAFGENQHLYQASAMICNFFVAASSLIAHRKAESFTPNILKFLIPAAVVAVMAGVALSNSSIFAREKSYLLARLFGTFLIYVAAYNSFRLFAKTKFTQQEFHQNLKNRPVGFIASAIGTVTGLFAGLLGIGAGTVAIPLQQLTLKIPIRNAMSNSAATITAIALLGAAYKNLTLPEQGIHVQESLKIAACLIPTAIIGGLLGGHLMHKLPRNAVRVVFIIVLILAAIKLINTTPN